MKHVGVSSHLLSTESTKSKSSLMDSLNIPVPLPAATCPMTSDGHRHLLFAALLLGNTCTYALGSLYPSFMPMEAQIKGVRPSGIGWIISIHQLAMCLLAPVSGHTLTWVSPKRLLICGFALVSACGISFGALHWSPAGQWFLTLSLVIRFFEGVGDVIVKTASFATVIMLYPDRAPIKMGQYFISSGLGTVIGAFSGGILVQLGGFYQPFFLFGSLRLLPVLFIALAMPDGKYTMEKTSLRQTVAMFADAEIFLCFLVDFFAFVVYGFVIATLQLQISLFTPSAIIIGFVFVAFGLIFSISTAFWGYLCQRWDKYEVMNIFVCCISCVGLLLYGPANFLPVRESFWGILMGALLTEYALGGIVVIIFSRCLKNCKRRGFPNDLTTYGQVSSLVSMGLCMGAFVGSLCGGYLYEIIGMRRASVFLFSGEAVVVVLLVVHFLWKLTKFLSPRNSQETDPLLSRRQPQDTLCA